MAPPLGYALIWNDEFDGTVLDTTKWIVASPTCEYSNNLNPANVALDGNSNVVFTCADKNYGGGIASACDRTGAAKFDFLYGYVEVRMKLGDTGNIPGIFCDLWMNGSQGWPPEIDITESGTGVVGDSCNGPNYMDMTLWFGSSQNVTNNFPIKDANGNPLDLSKDFHIYGMEWTTTFVRFLMDGVETWRITNVSQIPSKRMYITSSIYPDTNNSIWGCGTDFAHVPFPVHMYIDYVRVYQISTNIGTLDVSSVPTGAEISIDNSDEKKATTMPFQQITDIPAGNHILTLTLAGYQPYTTVFTIIAGKTTTLSPTLTPVSQTTGTLAISSSPSGASIFVDGTSKGITPGSLTLAAGTYSLRLSLTSYQDYTANFTITVGQTTTLNPTLIKISGSVPTYLTLSPLSATIRIGMTRSFIATVLDQNNLPMANVPAVFTGSNNSIGTMNPATATTGANGTAKSTLTGIAAGTMTLHASVAYEGVNLTSNTATITVRRRYYS